MDMSGQEQSGQVTRNMSMEGSPSWLPSFHAGSGSNSQPASVPAHLWMITRSSWDLMAHGALFLTYKQQGGPRGKGKADSGNYVITTEKTKLCLCLLHFLQMFS